MFFALFSAIVFAGPNSSGGGMSVHCVDTGKEQVKVLDYFEAEAYFGKKHVANATGDLVQDVQTLIESAVFLQGGKVPPSIESTRKNLERLLSMVKWVSSDELPFLDDHGGTLELPDGCTLRQLAIYNDDQQVIKVARDIWSKLDSMNRAALLMHEIWYGFGRKYSEVTSEITRSYIRHMLTAQLHEPVSAGKEKADYICRSDNRVKDVIGGKDMEFYVYNRQLGATLQFGTIAERRLLIKTTADIDFRFDITHDIDPERSLFRARPSDLSAFETVSVPLQMQTRHQTDLTLNIKFHGGKSILIQAFAGSVALGPEVTIYCDFE